MLLAEAVAGVVQAQRVLDADASSRVQTYFEAAQGETVLPPLWFSFGQVKLELEMSSAIVRPKAPRAGAVPDVKGDVQLMGRMLNPTTVCLFGYAASSGLRVTLTLEPRELQLPQAMLEQVPVPSPAPSPTPPPP